MKYGPASTVVMYVDIALVGAKSQRLTSGSPARGVRRVSMPLEDTCQRDGAMNVKGEFGLEVGLFEVGEHAAGVGRLVLGVEVALAVGRVEETVHTLPGGAVQRGPGDGDLVLRLQVVQPDPGAVHNVGNGEPVAVQGRCSAPAPMKSRNVERPGSRAEKVTTLRLV